MIRSDRFVLVRPLVALAVLFLGVASARATDGTRAAGSTDDGSTTTETSSLDGTSSTATYYEAALGGTSTDAWEDPGASLPERLHVVEGDARVRYLPIATEPDTWEVRIEGFERRHETVAAVYDMILVLPLPAAADGRDAFAALDRAVQLYAGSPEEPTPLVYGGETLRLKRNVALEKTLLPSLVDGSSPGTLPGLAGTGYRYTVWDTIVTRDPHFGDPVSGWASLRYTSAPDASAPDDTDERFAAWWITWIPSLVSELEPYAVRMDVAPVGP